MQRCTAVARCAGDLGRWWICACNTAWCVAGPRQPPAELRCPGCSCCRSAWAAATTRLTSCRQAGRSRPGSARRAAASGCAEPEHRQARAASPRAAATRQAPSCSAPPCGWPPRTPRSRPRSCTSRPATRTRSRSTSAAASSSAACCATTTGGSARRTRWSCTGRCSLGTGTGRPPARRQMQRRRRGAARAWAAL